MTDLNTHSKAGKRLYRQPEFRVFGTISQLTEAVGDSGADDNGSELGFQMIRT